jgi:dienelactone hydrolase
VRATVLALSAALGVGLAGWIADRAVAPSRQRLVPTAERRSPPFAVGERVITFVDRSRTVTFPGHAPKPRTLVTVVRYPADGPPGAMDIRNAAPARAAGPFPLIVFGHGFAVTPATYYRLLRAWTQAGYVVAAPVFPLEGANTPGGPNESDLVNQPRDMSFVISSLLSVSASAHALLTGLIAPRQIAVSGQSDGGETALAVAYDRSYRDRRVRAAVILSGAQIPSVAALAFPTGAPALLAAQGTADTTNLPRNTYTFFALARRPKFLLQLIGAPHLPPYTGEEPQLGIVERVAIAFLDRYVKGERDGLARMKLSADRPATAVLVARP